VEKRIAEAVAPGEAKRCLRCDLKWLDLTGQPRPSGPAEATSEQPVPAMAGADAAKSAAKSAAKRAGKRKRAARS
jgi:hypothetical protein